MTRNDDYSSAPLRDWVSELQSKQGAARHCPSYGYILRPYCCARALLVHGPMVDGATAINHRLGRHYIKGAQQELSRYVVHLEGRFKKLTQARTNNTLFYEGGRLLFKTQHSV